MKVSLAEKLLGGAFLAFLILIFGVTYFSAPAKNIATPSPEPVRPYFVNINTADAAELDSLDGIGPVLAEKIVEYREEHGSFKSVDNLADVPGIGSFVVSKIKDSVVLK